MRTSGNWMTQNMNGASPWLKTALLLCLTCTWGMANAKEEARVFYVLPAEGGAGINRAIGQCGKEGGEVVLAPGTYPIASPIVIRTSGVTLRGAGPATKLRLMANASCPVLIVGDEANNPRREVRRICVADLAIDGNRTQQRGECWGGHCDTGESTAIRSSGLVIRRAKDILVLRVSADNCRSGGLVTEKHCRRLTVRDFSAARNEFDGLACYETEDSLFTGLHLHDNKSAGISTDLSFDHNIISDSRLVKNGTHGVFMRHSSHNHFQNILVSSSGRDGLFVDQVEDQAHTASVGNHFTAVKVVGSKGPALRVNAPSCKGTVLNQCVFADNKEGLKQAVPGLVQQRDLVVK
jgi:hypothetical protein